MTSKVVYRGDLRTEAVHLQSGSEIITDAPVDNHGKGEAFSPTDTVATALASCMLTVMGIKAEDLKLSLNGTSAEVTKTMATNPRRISKVEIKITFPETYSEKSRKVLENTAKTCPVLESLHPDMEKIISFNYL
ncbi:OsmC family protein [Salegentibacter sp. Hel_I_6]|uniref:OsmC family protein n=1 Tax=Salegentibacter sp. Hel_I_6 TaxID=1250278 RepID=UPI000565D82C|nr:OsmC family protein [Salegentibacter sp. Hel_I_6]